VITLVERAWKERDNMNEKVLIAYFSRAGQNYVSGSIIDLPVGNTEVAAKIIQRFTDGVIFKIEPQKEYSSDYEKCVEQSRQELKQNMRPKLKENLKSIDNFDTIILAYPNWCGTMPMPVFTFLESFDFSGKKILPLCTNEGSGMGQSESDIKRICRKADIRKGLAVYGSRVINAESEIEAWLKKENV